MTNPAPGALASVPASVRPWRLEDAPLLVPIADNRKIWLNLRDAFPHPYRLEHAEAFIKAAVAADPMTFFAIEMAGAPVGGIGLTLGTDVERIGAEIGYWLAEPLWGRGLMSGVVRETTSWAIERFGLLRVFAVPYAWNAASCRVLEKAGYLLEGRLRRSVIKDGQVIDQLLYAYVTGG